MSKGTALPDEQFTDEMFELIGGMINDPDESWWVVHGRHEGHGTRPARS